MAATLQIKQEQGKWAVIRGGVIIASFDTKFEASRCVEAQRLADEQSEVLSAYNDAEVSRALLAEALAEFQ